MMDYTLRPLSLSQVLDRTFSLYRQNFLLFAGIAALPPALVMLGQLGFLLVGIVSRSGNSAASVAGIAAAVLIALAFFGLALVGYALAAGASVYAVSRVHLGYKTTIVEAYKLMLSHLGPILGIVVLAYIVVILPIVVGVVFLVIPIAMAGFGRSGEPSAGVIAGIVFGVFVVFVGAVASLFLSAKLSLSVAVCVLERRGVFDSLKRAWSLADGAIWRVILVFLLAGAISTGLSLVLSIPYVIGMVLVISKKDPSAMTPFLAWQYFAQFLARALAGPIATIAVALIYYDQRVRKEAFDLQLMMEAIGQQAPPPPTPTPAPPLIG
jgi:hypothetical protein